MQLFVQHPRSRVRRHRPRRERRRAGAGDGRREADAGTRSSGAARRARDVLSEMFHPQKARLAAREATRALERMGQPSGDFDSSRYFRGPIDFGFYNVGTAAMRELARAIHADHKSDWSIGDAMAFADALIEDRHLEAKSVGVEVVTRYRRDFTPRLLPAWKRWFAANHSANCATTDTICGALLGPLLVQHPALAVQMRSW